jgi:hypothetical protein
LAMREFLIVVYFFLLSEGRSCAYLRISEFEDIKGVIRIRKSKDRKHNGQKKKDKRTNNDLQDITQKTKDQETPILRFTNSDYPFDIFKF